MSRYGIPLVEMVASFPDGAREVLARGEAGERRVAVREGIKVELGMLPAEQYSTRAFIRNSGKLDENVHPFVELRTSGWLKLRRLHDAKDQKIPTDIFDAEVFGRRFFFGLRCNRMLGVDPIVDEAAGTVSWPVYDTKHIRACKGAWGSENVKGDDPASRVRPTLPGGNMICWTLGGGFYVGAVDAPPVPDWRAVKKRLHLPDWDDLPSRVQAMVRNWAEIEAVSDGDDVPRFQDAQRDSFLFWAISGASRFLTWDADPSGDIFAKRTGGFDSHPLCWGGLVNVDGATANHYHAAWGAIAAWVWLCESASLGQISDPYDIQKNLAWWLASQWLLYSATTARNWSDGDAFKGNDFYEKSDNGGERVYLGRSPGFRSAEYKSWSRNLIAADAALPGDPMVADAMAAYEGYLAGDLAKWSGRWSERGPARRIMNLIEFGVARGNQRLLQRVASRVDEMIGFSDNYGRLYEWDRNPSGLTNTFISAKAALAVGMAIQHSLFSSEAQKDRWTTWLEKRVAWLAEDGIRFIAVEGGGERATCNYFITPQRIEAAYNKGTVCANVPSHSMTAAFPDNMFSDAYLANAFGLALVVCRADFHGRDLVERAWRGLVEFLGEGFDYAGMDIGEQKKIVSGATEFPTRVLDAKDGLLDYQHAPELRRLSTSRRADHWQCGNWNNKKETFAVLEVLPGCVMAKKALAIQPQS